MAGPLDPIDRRIDELRAVHERISQNLVELDADVTRKMLQSSTTLRGRSAEAWAGSSVAIENLWRGQMALADLLERLMDVRGTRSFVTRAALAKLSELLDGPSLTVPRPGRRPSLTESTAPTEQCTVQDAIARMSADYDTVLALLSEVGAAWTVVIPRLEVLDRVLGGLETAADASGGHRPNELALVRQSLADALAVARDDPLALDVDVLESLPAKVDRIAEFFRQSQSLVQDVLNELAGMRAQVDGARSLLEAAERITAENAAKVLPSAGRRTELGEAQRLLVITDDALVACRAEAEVDAAQARRHLGDLRRRVIQLDQVCARLAEGNGASVVERDELRGRLVAFRAKAHALGRGEDLGLGRLYREASDALYQAPCDLDHARALVLSYQRAVRPTQGGAG
jgi:hypothetical protein